MSRKNNTRRQEKIIILLWALLFVVVVAVSALLLREHNFAVLNPKGLIAHNEYRLILFASLLSLFVVIPVFAMTFFIVWRYRASNSRAAYRPEWDHNRTAEAIWWGIPLLLILVLAIVTWKSSHDLDPYKPLSSTKQPVTIQVVALQWKWLFIYPEHNVASVNFLQIPTDTPINFQVTADAPMNSFWIPQLGGQIYAMNGMTTKLHLLADEPGDYRGVSANLSGEGFSGMDFIARASSEAEFDAWVSKAKQSDKQLTKASYADLAKPSKNAPVTLYRAEAQGLYGTVLMKYMMPSTETADAHDGEQDSRHH
jgi:cytochrome o ubiquinol oxidase subunit 2